VGDAIEGVILVILLKLGLKLSSKSIILPLVVPGPINYGALA